MSLRCPHAALEFKTVNSNCFSTRLIFSFKEHKTRTQLPSNACLQTCPNWTLLLLPACAVVCPVIPTVAISNAAWVTGCSNNTVGATCSAACTGEGTPPTATCTRTASTNTATWTLTSAGTCTNTYRLGSTCANINPGAGSVASEFICSNGLSLKSSPASINITSLTELQATGVCCDTLHSSTDTCGASVTCPPGSSAKPGTSTTLVNGLVVNGLEAVSRCCVQVGGVVFGCSGWCRSAL
jgi:hypothetical protein